MKVSKKDAVSLLAEGGLEEALSWSNRKLDNKLNDLLKLREGLSDLSPENEALARKVCEALQEGEEIEVTADEEDCEEVAESPRKVTRNLRKAAPVEDEEDSQEAEEDEKEDKVKINYKKPGKKVKVVEVKKPRKQLTVKKEVEALDHRRKPGGVIQTIIAVLRKGTAKKPKSKEDILEALVKKFPERKPIQMMSTISSQVPSGLRISKGLDVQKNEKGYWLEPDDYEE